MERIAIYGKGGVGKSVVATSLSVLFARQGKRVLHVGCDPKHDSSLRLLERAARLRTVLDVLAADPMGTRGENIVNRGRYGIDCCESGGPEPGQGCGGRGVARMIEYLEERRILESGGYDVVLFDVLGDVVCGGFAAPLRMGFAKTVYIVISEEPMALYAANNICKAVHTYADNGVALGGLIANLRDNSADRTLLKRFADILSTELVAFIPRDPRIQEAEKGCQTVVERFPDSEASRILEALGERILAANGRRPVLPSPMSDEEFFRLLGSAWRREP